MRALSIRLYVGWTRTRSSLHLLNYDIQLEQAATADSSWIVAIYERQSSSTNMCEERIAGVKRNERQTESQ